MTNLAIIEREGLVERAGAIGDRLGPALRALATDGAVTEVRGIGGMWAVDVEGEALPVRDRLLDAGIIVRAIGPTLVLCPPLVITDDEIDAIVDGLAACL